MDVDAKGAVASNLYAGSWSIGIAASNCTV